VVSVAVFLVAFPALLILWRRGSPAATPQAGEQARS
jgi:hypothetical protein